MVRHAQITQNNKFGISLEFRKKKMSDEVDFMHADRHESLPQIDTMILIRTVKHSESSQKFAISLQYLKKEIRNEVGFLHSDKHQSFLEVDFNTLGIKVTYKVILSLLMGMIKHSQSTKSNKFAISLQYLKEEAKNGVHLLHVDKHQSFCKLALAFLMEVARHVQSTQKRKLVMFLQYIKKMLQLLLCSIALQNIQMFFGGSSHVCFLFVSILILYSMIKEVTKLNPKTAHRQVTYLLRLLS